MIRSTAFNKATIIASSLQDSGKGLVALEDTPVGRLVAPLIAPNLFKLNQGDTLSIPEMISIIQKTAEVEGTDPYDFNLKQFVQLASRGVRNTIHLTRSVALPVIEDITQKVEETINNEVLNRGLALNIVDDSDKEILDSAILANAVERYIDTALRKDIGNAPYHDPRSSEQVLELMQVGLEQFDKEVKEWLGMVTGSEKAIDLYSRIFATGAPPALTPNIIGRGKQAYVNAIIVFLLARGLIADLDDNINLNKAQYDLVMSEIICYSALVIKAAIETRKGSSNLKHLVEVFPPANEEFTYHDPSRGVIIVNKSLYEQFLNEGGSPEAIMGSYLTDRETTYDLIVANTAKYTSAYNTQVMRARSDANSKALSILRKVVQKSIYAEIQHCDPSNEDKGLWGGISIDTNKAYALADKHIAKLNVLDLDDIYMAVRFVVLETFFKDTDTAELLNYIDSARRFGGKEDLQTAINVALVDYIVNWFLTQTKVVI